MLTRLGPFSGGRWSVPLDGCKSMDVGVSICQPRPSSIIPTSRTSGRLHPPWPDGTVNDLNDKRRLSLWSSAVVHRNKELGR